MKKISIMIFALILSVSAFAQHTFFNPLSTAGVFPQADTVVNTATAFISTRLMPVTSQVNEVLVWISVTKISGTVGGTITLQGSIDGTNWKAINTNDSQTALATITATDASNTYHYRLSGGNFPYLRVSWTGTGTMSASFSAKAYRN